MSRIENLHGHRALICAPQGPVIATERDATDIIGDAFSADVTLVVLPVARLAEGFFQLSTRMAGDIIQKFVNYGFQVVILGDISLQVAASNALRDYVYESNLGRQVWFVSRREELEHRLA